MAQEVCCAGKIENISALLKEYRLPPDMSALTLVEMQPLSYIEQHQRQDLLRFAHFENTFDLTSYTSGRIFHREGELRWEKQADAIQLVYTGLEQYRPEFKVSARIELNTWQVPDRRYFLFGKRLNDPELLRRIGPLAKTGDFAEARIPRLLRYPAPPGVERVQLVVREYSDPESGAGVAFRFVKLVEAGGRV